MIFAKAEILSTSLINRYDERRAEQLAEEMAAMPTTNDAAAKEVEEEEEEEKRPSAVAPSDGGDGDGVNVAPQLPGGVVPLLLYERLKSGKENILIVDVRPADEFRQAAMKFPEKVISVPAEIISPGLTINRIEVQSRNLRI